MVEDLYARYEWMKNGIFKQAKLEDNEIAKEYTVKKKIPFYLSKIKDKAENIL